MSLSHGALGRGFVIILVLTGGQGGVGNSRTREQTDTTENITFRNLRMWVVMITGGKNWRK